LSIDALAVTMGLGTIRVGVAFLALPQQGEALPGRMRAALALMLALCLTPIAKVAPGLTGDGHLAFAALGEGCFGLVIGFGMRLCLSLADIAGQLVGSALGLSYATFVDPMQGDETAATSELLRCVMWLAFFATGGLEAIVSAIATSFSTLPLGTMMTVDLSGLGSSVDRVFLASVQVAAPVLLSVLFVQVGLAVTSRIASELHPLSIAFAALLLVGLWAFSGVMDGAFAYGRTMSLELERWILVTMNV
jgi:flagellar biosynthetic protein FliR